MDEISPWADSDMYHPVALHKAKIIKTKRKKMSIQQPLMMMNKSLEILQRNRISLSQSNMKKSPRMELSKTDNRYKQIKSTLSLSLQSNLFEREKYTKSNTIQMLRKHKQNYRNSIRDQLSKLCIRNVLPQVTSQQKQYKRQTSLQSHNIISPQKQANGKIFLRNSLFLPRVKLSYIKGKHGSKQNILFNYSKSKNNI